MLNQLPTIAGKEVTDSWRDRRGLLSAALYSLMGPGVVSLVSLAIRGQGKHGEGQSVLIAMMSVFTLVSAFAGGMNVAMDSIAGERERRSLLPLLMHPVTRLDVLLGKWLAVAAFSVASLTLNVLGFALLLRRVPPWQIALCLIPLSLLAAALEIWVSTVCRGVKEANTYLSMLVFLPMGLGMFMVFSPVAGQVWWNFLPVAGQQLQLEASMRGEELDMLRILFLTLATAALASLALLAAADRLEQDDVVYGG
jgi:sodium transport system permease protein